MIIFAHVAAADSFTRAADKLQMPRSMVSKAVSTLEEGLGVRLLYRTTRQLSLTEEGRVFNEYCKRILAEAEAAEQALAQLSAAPQGRLRISCPSSFGSLWLNPILSNFMQRYPGLAIDVDYNDNIVDMVETGFDAVIRVTPELPDSSLIARRLTTTERLLVATPSYCRDHGTPRTPDELKEHNCIIYNGCANPDRWAIVECDGKSREVHVSGLLSANTGEAVRSAAVHDVGIARLPSFLCASDLAAGRLIRILDRVSLPDCGIFVLYPHKHHLAAKVRVFIDFLLEHFGSDGDPFLNTRGAASRLMAHS